MRANRVTLRQAQQAYDAIQCGITLAPYQGAGIPLPKIDMQGIFKGRQSMTWQHVVEAVAEIINKKIPT